MPIVNLEKKQKIYDFFVHFIMTLFYFYYNKKLKWNKNNLLLNGRREYVYERGLPLQ